MRIASRDIRLTTLTYTYSRYLHRKNRSSYPLAPSPRPPSFSFPSLCNTSRLPDLECFLYVRRLSIFGVATCASFPLGILRSPDSPNSRYNRTFFFHYSLCGVRTRIRVTARAECDITITIRLKVHTEISRALRKSRYRECSRIERIYELRWTIRERHYYCC